MLVTDVGDQMWPIWYIGKITNIMILPPTSEISHHHKVTNITMSPTSLSPFEQVKTRHLSLADTFNLTPMGWTVQPKICAIQTDQFWWVSNWPSVAWLIVLESLIACNEQAMTLSNTLILIAQLSGDLVCSKNFRTSKLKSRNCWLIRW